ncbi:MAG TPA: YebC/PmpR family DNA-binding transcriptional regulator [Candidatus Saccharimonadales bacterium]|nr:YebC/PmpR family DNA-binding transcriptional regulator [Candidatus Saccharimonadales bacterium]
MSGHSKWATIKRAKGANDAKRGQLFTKLSKAISIAVRQGGGTADPNMNFKLRLAIEAARNANMPKDNIDRAIQRATGAQAEQLDEVLYEGFGPGGFSVVVEGLTNNKVRTVAEVKSIFNKNGGSMGAQGSVMYQFDKKAVITVDKGDKTLDDIFLIAADHGVDDIEDAGTQVILFTKPDDLAKVRDALQKENLSIKGAEFTFRPIVNSAITSKEEAERALNFIEKLEDNEDVQNVYANFDIPDELIEDRE